MFKQDFFLAELSFKRPMSLILEKMSTSNFATTKNNLFLLSMLQHFFIWSCYNLTIGLRCLPCCFWVLEKVRWRFRKSFRTLEWPDRFASLSWSEERFPIWQSWIVESPTNKKRWLFKTDPLKEAIHLVTKPNIECFLILMCYPLFWTELH